MNWIRSSLKYLGIYSSPEEKLLKDDFHYQSDEEVSKKSADTLSTIKSFAKKYPVRSDRDQESTDTDILTSNIENEKTLQTQQSERQSADSNAKQSDNVQKNNYTQQIYVIEDSDLMGESVHPEEISTAQLVKNEKKKKKGIKKVKKRVSWAVRRSWKWIKRGWSGYAPGVAAGMMYCSNAPSTIFNIYNK